MISGGPCPVVALDAEVVITLDGQVAQSGAALKEPLCQCDAGRDAVFDHLLDGQVLVLVDILLVLGVLLYLPAYRQADGEDEQQRANFSHDE